MKTIAEMSVEEKARKYEEYMRKMKNRLNLKRNTPYYKQLASIRQMIYQAKKRGDMARVAELEQRRQKLKEEHRKQRMLSEEE